MAKTHQSFLETCQAVKSALSDLREVRSRFRELVDHHNAAGFSDAADTPKPSYINEDNLGNIDGTYFTRAEYINAVNLMLQFEAMMTGGVVSVCVYRDSLEKVVDA